MFIFPVTLLTPATVQRRVVGQTLSGGVALSGDEDVIAADGGGRWLIDYQGIELVDARAARVWEAWLDHLEGGVAVVLVPLLSMATSPRPGTARTRAKRPSGIYVDDEEWPTEMRYGLADHEATIAGARALRATRVSFDVSKGPAPRGGEIFSVGQRAYRVRRPDGADYLISPPLREALAGGEPAIFDLPLVRAKAAPGQDFSSPLARGIYGTVGIQFVETTT